MDTIEAVKNLREDLRQCIDDGVKNYKKLMESLLATKQPLKDSRLFAYHTKSLETIKKAFDESYEGIADTSMPNTTMGNFTTTRAGPALTIGIQILQLLALAKLELEREIKKQFDEVYLQKNEIMIDATVRKVKGFTNQAEMLYDDQVEQNIPKNIENTKTTVELAHKSRHEAATELFCQLMKESSICEDTKKEDFWCYELNYKLKERLKELVEETQTDVAQNPVSAGIGLPHATPNLTPVHQTNPLPNTTPELEAQSATMNVGIYFDSSSFKVGTISSSKTYNEIASELPEIHFSDTSITIGAQAHVYRFGRNHINIFELLTVPKNSSVHPLEIRGAKYDLCSHEVIAAFFHQVLSNIENLTGVKIGQIVFTIPFTPTSAVKERIKESARIAGYSGIRILSTVLTAAVATVGLSSYFATTTPPQLVFVLHLEETSFSVGLVEISAASISVKYSFGTSNMAECQVENFKEAHRRLYNGLKLDKSCIDYLLYVYQIAVKKVARVTQTWKVSVSKVVVTERLRELLEPIVLNYFDKSGTIVAACEGPLFGASKLASFIFTSTFKNLNATHAKAVLPPSSNILIQDSSRSNLLLRISNEVEKESRTELKRLRGLFAEGQSVFFYELKMSLLNDTPGICCVIIDELYRPSEAVFEAFRYQFTCTSIPVNNLRPGESATQSKPEFPPKNKVYIHIVCSMDADGVYSLSFDDRKSDFPANLQVVRLNNMACDSTGKHAELSGFGKLIQAYKHSDR